MDIPNLESEKQVLFPDLNMTQDTKDKFKAETEGFRSTLSQVLVIASASWLCTGIGLIVSMPTIVIGALRGDSSSPMALSESQASWFGSLLFIIEPLGSVVAAFFQDLLGRRTCLWLANVPISIAWVIIYFSATTSHLFIAMIIMGFSIGFIEAPYLAYLGEISQPRIRGVLSSFGGIFYNSGLMIESFLGAVMPWRTMILCSVLAPVSGFIAMGLMPESPAWLVTKGRLSDAEKAYQWVRGWVRPEAIRQEFDDLVSYVKRTQRMKVPGSAEYTPVTAKEDGLEPPQHRSLWQTMTEPEVLIAFRIILLYFIVSACASLTAMKPFLIEILTNLNSPVRPHVVVAVCGVLQMLGAASLGVGMKSLGKRRLTFLSLGLSIFCCFGLAAYLMLGANLPWLPVLLFWISFYCSSLGIVHIPWILIIELFPLRARGMAGGLTSAFGYCMMFIVIKTYYNLVSVVNVSGACCVYGAVGLIGLVYLYWDMPETEGFSLEVIERKLTERRSTRRDKTAANQGPLKEPDCDTQIK